MGGVTSVCVSWGLVLRNWYPLAEEMCELKWAKIEISSNLLRLGFYFILFMEQKNFPGAQIWITFLIDLLELLNIFLMVLSEGLLYQCCLQLFKLFIKQPLWKLISDFGQCYPGYLFCTETGSH